MFVESDKSRRRALLAAAVAATLAPAAVSADEINDAGYTDPPFVFRIATSGATALSQLTRGNNSSGGGSGYNRGITALGTPQLQIGRTQYTQTAAGQFLTISNTGAPLAQEPSPAGPGNDHLSYYYLESGSIQGVLDLVDSNGLRIVGGVVQAATLPRDPNSSLNLWVNGNRFNARNTGPVGGYSVGQNYNSDADYLAQPRVQTPGNFNGQPGEPFVRIAWSDVRSEQGFAVSGTAADNKAPTQAGYGLGRGAIGGTNFQQLRNENTVDGGVADPATTRLRNESLAIVPFTIASNPRNGLVRLTEGETRWLAAAGRLPNGANFNSITREIGSGTRNQGGNNLNLDPTWASGERDRIYTGTAPINTQDANGNPVTINTGSELSPALLLAGSTSRIQEDRVGPWFRSADKVSGSSNVRATVLASGMGIGVPLSAGDATGFATVGGSNQSSQPIRALAIDWEGDAHGYVQPSAQNTTEGIYQMWSASQAITVTPVGHSLASDVTDPGSPGFATGRPINGDTDDQLAVGKPADNIGVHRKFLDNITRSVATLSAAPNNQTPADAAILAGFIPPQLMGVTKQFDGAAQSPRTRSTTDPDGAGPQLSEQAIWDIVTAPGGALYNSLNWQDPATVNGNLTGGAVRYNVYAPNNTLASSNANADLTITVNSRTNLVGDLNNDGVRDFGDVARLAHAYASPADFLARFGDEAADADNQGFDAGDSARTLNNSVVAVRAGGLLGAAPSGGVGGLLALTDLDSNGNVRETAPGSGAYTVDAVARGDVRYFLYGAAVDSGAGTAAQRREDGVRTGQLRKNAAIDTFNAALDALVDDGQPGDVTGFTQGQADALKFNKFDANGDGAVNRNDAAVVDRNVGRNYTNFADVMSTGDDLVAAEFNDNNAISHVGAGVSDMSLVVGYLQSLTPSRLLDGDTNFDGAVDVTDLGNLATSWELTGRKWSQGDFNFDGTVDVTDLGALATNWDTSSPLSLSFPAALAEFPALAAAVPEPAALGVLGVGVAGLLRRRRHA